MSLCAGQRCNAGYHRGMRRLLASPLPVALLLAAAAVAQTTVTTVRVVPGDGGEERTYSDPKIVLPGGRVVVGLPVMRDGAGRAIVAWRDIRYLDIIPADGNPTAAIVFRDGREEMVDVERGWLLPGRGADPGLDFGVVWRLVVLH